MAVPKRKKSKSKRDMRRTHKKIDGMTVATCPNCGESVAPHQVCGNCGQYKGKTILKTDEE